MKTLIVEDTLINQEFLKMIVEQWGESVVADSGEQALEKFSHAARSGSPFEVVFMDIMLPGMDGLQALEKIRAVESESGIDEEGQAKVIVMTALDDDTNAMRAFMHGKAVSYMTKPVRQDAVQAELEKLGLIPGPESTSH